MINFIDFVVGELKNKRLSKQDAVALFQQFSLRPPVSEAAATNHPLLHKNTSDLWGQCYTSTFAGNEFFLADHQVMTNIGASQKVLPGVAYLEMVRVAIEQAWPGRPDPASLELRNTIWAQPFIVNGNGQINLALSATDNDEIDYEIYTREAEEEIIHCQGRAVWNYEPMPAKLDLEQLEREMMRGQIEPNKLYTACAGMGLIYGPALQTVLAIYCGNSQVLAHLRLPRAVEDTWEDYVLHPSVMDGALQACVGLIEGGLEEFKEPRLPFALESLRVLSPCTREMFGWVRYSKESQAGDNVAKVDIDLCDGHGSICVQMRGFSSRVLSHQAATATQDEPLENALTVSLPEGSGAVVSSNAGKCEPAETRIEDGPAQMQGATLTDSAAPSELEKKEPLVAAGVNSESLAEKTQEYLRRQFSALLKLPVEKIDAQAALENYGIDSILAMKLTNQLEKSLGSLPKTLFFEYQTITALSEYFLAHYAAQLNELFAAGAAVVVKTTAKTAAQQAGQVGASGRSSKAGGGRRFSRMRNGGGGSRAGAEAEMVAIIGLSGRYPEAVDVAAYWENL
ncbi:MAG: hypothetical protein DMG65_00080, partial [Candidatus Angelobacter sp. Gp1-AA117]